MAKICDLIMKQNIRIQFVTVTLSRTHVRERAEKQE